MKKIKLLLCFFMLVSLGSISTFAKQKEAPLPQPELVSGKVSKISLNKSDFLIVESDNGNFILTTAECNLPENPKAKKNKKNKKKAPEAIKYETLKACEGNMVLLEGFINKESSVMTVLRVMDENTARANDPDAK